MAFKSIAQRDKMAELLKAGKITQEAFDKMAADTPADLPDRLHPKKGGAKPTEQQLEEAKRGGA